MYVWRKLSAAKWEDVWPERLAELRDRLAITHFAGRKTIRVEAFALTKAQADRLMRDFGGEAFPQKKEVALQPPTRAPIRVRNRLVVVCSEAERPLAEGRPVLVIPAGMAFGTGDHATTATCLRLLADVSDERRGEPWELLDLGCGTAILAAAGRIFGARRVEAGDFDADAVRVSKENVRANGLTQVRVQKMDVRAWTPERTWEVVVANLFSGLLVEVASKIAAATAPGGRLIFSGVLRAQEAEVVAAFETHGFQMERIVRKGKWIAGLATRAK